MSKHTAPSLVAPGQSSNLQRVNEKIAKMAAANSTATSTVPLLWRHSWQLMRLRPRMNFKTCPGIDPHAFELALNFWHRTRDCNRVAALDCAGGNQSLAEALVTFRL